MSDFPFVQSSSGGNFPPFTESSLNQSSNPNSAVFTTLESTPLPPASSSATPSFKVGSFASSTPSFGTSPSVFGVTGSSPFITTTSALAFSSFSFGTPQSSGFAPLSFSLPYAYATSSATTTQTSLVLASTNGTSTTIGAQVAGSPNMPSEITEEIVKEVIMEGNTEPQECPGRFWKQQNEELKKRLKEMEEELEDKDSDLEQREALISALLVKERSFNDEILEARKLLISELRDLTDDTSSISVKRMGHLDEKPFIKASMQRVLTGEDSEVEYDNMLYLEWEENLKDPHWHPFKHIVTGNTVKEVVDEEDEKLMNLREEWGEEVMNAVKTALEEVNEFNPSGRHVVTTLWNSEQGRTATLIEAITHMLREKPKNPKGRKNW